MTAQLSCLIKRSKPLMTRPRRILRSGRARTTSTSACSISTLSTSLRRTCTTGRKFPGSLGPSCRLGWVCVVADGFSICYRHDIGLQIIGQPARDLCRHFIQRWNYLLRTKNHTVKMPFLIPSPDFTPRELQEQRITGTCEMQICRSVGPWSMGISHIEHSIQNAYCKAIQLSDHFVYIGQSVGSSSFELLWMTSARFSREPVLHHVDRG